MGSFRFENGLYTSSVAKISRATVVGALWESKAQCVEDGDSEESQNAAQQWIRG
jgi:hypothetical protein